MNHGSDYGARAGQIGWIDLTVPDAVRDFYKNVTGWTFTPVAMGEYQDYCMNAANGQSVAGICHARGCNRDQPPMWIIYIIVAGLEDAMRRCTQNGGKVLRLHNGTAAGANRYCLIEDPAGAVAALFQARG